jgi:5-methylcytosine-specific restriction endonuclease McrA
MAEVVRYVRGCRADGRYERPDVKEAIQTRVAMVLGGGYRERERRLSEEIRAQVFQRAGGHCEECGRVLDFDRSSGDPDAIPTIQHVAGDSSDISNLKAFCRRCNLAEAQSRYRPVEAGSTQDATLAQMVMRWSAPTPLRLCDDHERWAKIWRELSQDAMEAIEWEEASGDEDLPGFLGWTNQGTPIQNC